jgi:hypothetical protein
MSWRVQVRVCAQNVREHRSVAGASIGSNLGAPFWRQRRPLT